MGSREYGSEYERLVLTSEHPQKTQFKELEYPSYLAAKRFPWFATRTEELIVVVFLGAVFVYCSSVYVGFYVASYPVRLVLACSWDLMLGGMLALRVHGRMLPRLPGKKAIAAMPPAEQEEAQRKKKAAARAYARRRNLVLGLCSAAALMRWYYGWGDVRVLLP